MHYDFSSDLVFIKNDQKLFTNVKKASLNISVNYSLFSSW